MPNRLRSGTQERAPPDPDGSKQQMEYPSGGASSTLPANVERRQFLCGSVRPFRFARPLVCFQRRELGDFGAAYAEDRLACFDEMRRAVGVAIGVGDRCRLIEVIRFENLDAVIGRDQQTLATSGSSSGQRSSCSHVSCEGCPGKRISANISARMASAAKGSIASGISMGVPSEGLRVRYRSVRGEVQGEVGVDCTKRS